MEDRRFDDLTKTLTFASPRRAVVRLLSGGVLGGLGVAVAGFDPDDAAGKRKKKKKKKQAPVSPVSPLPPPPPPPPPGGCSPACTGGRICDNGTCTCTGTLRDCGDSGCTECCQSENFGYCCPPSRPNCANDFGREHYKVCAFSGACQCPANFPDECITNPNAPDLVCWECCSDETCASHPVYGPRGRVVCSGGGNCVCPPELPDLCGSCTDTDTDNENCGDCGRRCTGTGRQCCAGQCEFLPGCTTNSNMFDCRGRRNCGQCGRTCGDNEFCCNGQCVVVDEQNCGVCGAACPVNTRCCGAFCATTCPT